ncbi:unnamed protein product, partial [Hapterophycus canaliculatus]
VPSLNPEETLVIVVSKTFTTAETMLNARTLKDWLITSIKGKSSAEITSQHIVSFAARADRCCRTFGRWTGASWLLGWWWRWCWCAC